MRVIIIVFVLLFSSCSRQVAPDFFLKGKYFESHQGHLFGANKLWFNQDYTYKFIRNGPSIFLSTGSWQYNKINNTIELTSGKDIIRVRNTVDTMWMNMTGTVIKVKNKNKILFDNIIYYRIAN